MTARSSFLPCGAVTGIGSLPMTDPRAAVRFVAEASPIVPFWPQLPQRSEREGVIEQGLAGVADLIERRPGAYGYKVLPGRLDEVVTRFTDGSAALHEERAAGFFAFEKALKAGVFTQAVAVKGQIEGPITVAFYLFDGEKPFVSDPVLLDAIARHITKLALWQADRLRRYGLPLLLFIDEPGLCLASPHLLLAPETDLVSALGGVLSAIRASGAVAGLHCCAALPFAFMRRAKPDLFSFDAHQGVEVFFADPDARAFLQEGGQVAFGLIPTWTHLDTLSPESLFNRWRAAARGIEPLRDLARNSMVTATCGLGLLDETAARASFDMARSLALLIEQAAIAPVEAAINQSEKKISQRPSLSAGRTANPTKESL